MAHKFYGWLFGLEGTVANSLSLPGVNIRPMSSEELARILGHVTDFFAHDEKIWIGSTKLFPFVYEIESSDNSIAIGGESSVGVVLSLLSAGEVRTPIQWSKDEKGNGGGASSSDILSMFFRRMNGQFQTVKIEDIGEAFTAAVAKLRPFIFGSPNKIMGRVLLNRFMATKANPIMTIQGEFSRSHIIARAADVAMMLEYLFHEGSNSEVSFRLGMTVA